MESQCLTSPLATRGAMSPASGVDASTVTSSGRFSHCARVSIVGGHEPHPSAPVRQREGLFLM